MTLRSYLENTLEIICFVNICPEFVRLASHASTSLEFEFMSRWLQTLIQWGADPDLEPYPSEPIICHCQSSIFLKKLGTQPLGHFIHEVRENQAAYHLKMNLFDSFENYLFFT